MATVTAAFVGRKLDAGDRGFGVGRMPWFTSLRSPPPGVANRYRNVVSIRRA